MELRQLERNFRRPDAIHPLNQEARARFPDVILPPVMCRDARYLSDWRKIPWGGSPTLQRVLAVGDHDLLIAYRRLWGKSPLWTRERVNSVGVRTPDLLLSKGELFVIAHFLLGIDIEMDIAPSIQVRSHF